MHLKRSVAVTDRGQAEAIRTLGGDQRTGNVSKWSQMGTPAAGGGGGTEPPQRGACPRPGGRGWGSPRGPPNEAGGGKALPEETRSQLIAAPSPRQAPFGDAASQRWRDPMPPAR